MLRKLASSCEAAGKLLCGNQILVASNRQSKNNSYSSALNDGFLSTGGLDVE